MLKFKRRIQDSANGPTTYVAASTKIVGTITGKGAYVFCGTVEGDCDIEGPLTLADGGHWRGTLKATDIVVAGVVEGDVIAKQRVEILGTRTRHGQLVRQLDRRRRGRHHRGRDQSDERRARRRRSRKSARPERASRRGSSSASTARSTQLRRR